MTPRNPTSRAERLTCCAPLSDLPAEASIDSTAAVLKAIGHPVRLRILHVLASSKQDVCACDVEAHFDLAQPTISHHLRILRKAGLIESESRSPWVYFRLRPGAVGRLTEHLASLSR